MEAVQEITIENDNTPAFAQMSAGTERKVECIIKFGGSAITRKSEFEVPNMENIARAADLVSRLHGKCIIVHGAGSFGHFQAKEYGVARGYSSLSSQEQMRVREGFCKTRLSVTKLNHIVVEALEKKGVNAVGVGCCGRWSTKGRDQVASSDCERIDDLLQAGFLPVLHGDCVLDEELGCTILSGDTIIQVLCKYFKPKRVVFLSDVEGVFTKPPIHTDAKLIPMMQVQQDGSIATSIATKQLAHDVTGGIKTKIASACQIVSQSGGAIPVFICKLEGRSAELACTYGGRSKDFTGTIIEAGK